MLSDFPETFDFLEFVAQRVVREHWREEFMDRANNILEREKSPYRFVAGQLAPITSEAEVAEIEKANTATNLVANHIAKAIALYSDRKSPDYRNAVTEAISAVEAAARLVLGDKNATLGEAIRKLEKKGKVHRAFADAVSKLYGWASDTTRHAAKDGQPEIGEPEAKFMLVTCSAMANFLLTKCAA